MWVSTADWDFFRGLKIFFFPSTLTYWLGFWHITCLIYFQSVLLQFFHFHDFKRKLWWQGVYYSKADASCLVKVKESKSIKWRICCQWNSSVDHFFPCCIRLGRHRLHMFFAVQCASHPWLCVSVWLCLPLSALWSCGRAFALPTFSSCLLRGALLRLTLDSFGIRHLKQDECQFLLRFGHKFLSSDSSARWLLWHNIFCLLVALHKRV